MSAQQKEIEKKVFKAFCNVGDLPINIDSIENRNPPEPDIVCEVTGIGLLAFELTEIINSDYANNLNKQIYSINILSDYYSTLSMDQKKQFDKLYMNAMIFPRFQEECTMNKRKKVLPIIFEHLLSLDVKFEGITFENTDKYRRILSGIKITRGIFKGPLFDSNFATLFNDPTLPAIISKFNNSGSYKSEHPIHLLGYFDLQTRIPEEILLPSIGNFCEESIQKSKFVKIWIFDFQKGEIVFTYP